MIKKALKGAAETINLYKAVKAANKQSRKNLDLASIQIAKKQYKERTGKEFSPSAYRAELTGGIISKEYIQYAKDKKTARKEYKKRFGI